MFETMEGIIGICSCAAALLSAVAGFIVSLAKSSRNKKLAKAAQTTNEIAAMAKEKVVEVEKLYSQASQVLKATGVKTGELKKENVMNYIESRCVEKGIAFDEEYWSKEVESLIEVMNVNKS